MAKERLIITQGLCDKVKKLATHKIEHKEIADMLGISLATIGRIKAAGYDAENFKANNDLRRVKDYEKKNHKLEDKAHKQLEEMNKCIEKLLAEDKEEQRMKDQVPGQIKMHFPVPSEETQRKVLQQINALDQREKTMRFQAAMTEKLVGPIEDTNKTIEFYGKEMIRGMAFDRENNDLIMKMMGELGTKLNNIYDMMGQILRAIRKGP